MTSTVPSSKSGATFLWVLGAFVSFAVLFYLIQAAFARQGEEDPRAPERLANKEEIQKAQDENLAKMGLSDSKKKAAVFAKTLEALKARPEGVSAQLVPGSPTQLKQAAAPAEEAPAAAPASEAPPAAPAPAPVAPPLPEAAPAPAPAN